MSLFDDLFGKKKYEVGTTGFLGTVLGSTDDRRQATDAARALSQITPERVVVKDRSGHIVADNWGGAKTPAALNWWEK